MENTVSISLSELNEQFLQQLQSQYPINSRLVIHILEPHAENEFAEEDFWEIISLLRPDEEGNICNQKAILTLSRKPLNHIFYFDQLLNFFLDQLNTFTVASIIYANKDYSKKSFLYVRCGIIAKGKDQFEKIKDQPYLLEDTFQLKALLDIASKAYRLKMEGPADYELSQASVYNF